MKIVIYEYFGMILFVVKYLIYFQLQKIEIKNSGKNGNFCLCQDHEGMLLKWLCGFILSFSHTQ